MIKVFKEERDTFTTTAIRRPDLSWIPANSVVTGNNYKLIITGNGVTVSPQAYDVQTAPIIGHKYYIRARIKITNSVCVQSRVIYGGVDSVIVSSPVINQVYDASTVMTATTTSANMVLIHQYASAAIANGKVMEVTELVIIDLTIKYGAGLERTVAQMDKIKPLYALKVTDYLGTNTGSLVVNDFSTNGEKVIQPFSCIEIKQDNVDWRIEMEAPLSYQPFLLQDYILIVNTKEKGEQPFRINNVQVDGDSVNLTARHVGYDLINYINSFIFGYAYTANTETLLRLILESSIPRPPYSYSGDAVTGLRTEFKEQNSLANIFEIIEINGGHVVFDWWDVGIFSTIGVDNGITIEYGKNLQGAKVDEDWDEVCTSILPVGNNNLTLTPLTSPDDCILHASGVSYDRPYYRKIMFQTDSLTDLATYANAHLEKNKYPKLNYTVKADTVQNAGLGDIIYVYSRQFNISLNVLGYAFNILTREGVSIEFGNFRRDVKTVFSNIKADIDELKKSVVQENITMNAKFDYLGATFLGYRASALSFTNGIETKIDVDTTSYNTDTSVFELTGGGIKVKVAGTYLVSVKNSVKTTGTTGRLGTSVRQNTTSYPLGYIPLRDAYDIVTSTFVLVCAVDDIVYLYGYQNSGAGRALDPSLTGNHLQVTKIA
jgi:phage minor structural protein